VNGEHNHEMTRHFQGHKNVERLRPDETELVRELTENMAAPRNIKLTLKKRQETMATTIKHIYNVRHRMKKSDRGKGRRCSI
jgi:L-arabinose isomerase